MTYLLDKRLSSVCYLSKITTSPKPISTLVIPSALYGTDRVAVLLRGGPRESIYNVRTIYLYKEA